MYNQNSSPILTNCIFSNNFADYKIFENYIGPGHGGGMQNYSYKGECKPILNNCIFTGNLSVNYGGGMSNYNSKPSITNCTFSGNAATSYGGAIYNDNNSSTMVTNCILWNNEAKQGTEIALKADYDGSYPSMITVSYSDVQGGQDAIYIDSNCTVNWGKGNINIDPLFANPGYLDANGTPAYIYDDYWVEGDYHLKSQAGRWDPNTGSWVKDVVTSPCIDAGDPNGCLGYHEPHPNGRVINMGAYGGTDQASMSLSPYTCEVYWSGLSWYEWAQVGEPACWCYPRQCHGDTDCKAQGKNKYWVSTNDLDVLIAAWNKTFEEIEGKEVNGVPLICADFSHLPQGKQKFRVSTDDIDILIANWNQANGPPADCP
jgi:hypothetical protein